MPEHADYAEILRLYRKYAARPDEPLWVTFVRLGQQMERSSDKPHKVMTPEEYAAMPLQGWHEVYRDVDGFGGVGVRYLGV